MTISSKNTIANMVAGLMIAAAYILYATSSRAPASTDIRAWALLMLVFIGIGIGATIAVQILFRIGMSIGIAAREQGKTDAQIEEKIKETISCDDVEDEMDKLINLKSSHIGYIVMGTGFLFALIALALYAPVLTAIHIQLAACVLGALVEGIMTVMMYERGV